MKITTILLNIALLIATFCTPLQQSFAQTTNSDFMNSQTYFEQMKKRPKMKDYSREIEDLIGKMTVEEKVGQMTQLELGQITSGGDSNIQIDPAKLQKAIVDYKVGSILNVNGHALPVDKWYEIIGAVQTASMKTRLENSEYLRN